MRSVIATGTPLRGSHTAERRVMMGVMCFFFLTQVGCWEQVSEEWFPQMKWQPAVQAFEQNQYDHQVPVSYTHLTLPTIPLV